MIRMYFKNWTVYTYPDTNEAQGFNNDTHENVVGDIKFVLGEVK